ncbi:MAG: glycerophosphodiester phosphodiesterase, partial [Planctomycetales bacterium]
LFRSWIASTGRLAISNDEIAAFLLSPNGAAFLVLGVSVTIALAYAETAGFLWIAWHARQGTRVDSLQALQAAARRLPELLLLGFQQTASYLMLAAPFAGIAFVTYRALLTKHDVNYYLAQRPWEFWTAAAIGASLLLVQGMLFGWIYLRWLSALPAVLLENARPKTALVESWRRTRGRLGPIIVLLGGLSLGLALVGSCLGGIGDLLENGVLAAAGDRPAVVVPLVAASLGIRVAAAAAMAFLGIALHAILVLEFHQECSEGKISAEAEAPGEPRSLTLRRAMWMGAAAAVVFACAACAGIVENLNWDRRVAITAHRGSSAVAPENSLSALRIAIEQGADFAEIDVQETSDGTIVLLHDADLKRVTGQSLKIWETDYETIKTLDAGSWFSEKFRDERIPTLRQAIALARGKIKLNVELKFNGRDQQLVERVVGILEEAQFENQCVVTSLKREALAQVKARNKNLKVGLIVFRSLGRLDRMDVDFFSVNRDFVDAELTRSIHRQEKDLHVWTVNDAAGAHALMDLGADNLITDVPDQLISVRQARTESTNTERILLAARRWIGR